MVEIKQTAFHGDSPWKQRHMPCGYVHGMSGIVIFNPVIMVMYVRLSANGR